LSKNAKSYFGFLGPLGVKSQKAPKKFPCYKRYKNSRNLLDEKPNVNHGLLRRSQNWMKIELK
jgi:hypothetical protein